MRPRRAPTALALLVLLAAAPATAGVQLGDSAPDFTKNQLDFPSPGQFTPRSLSDYAGKVIVFFLFGCT